jgi:hypothetical protein
LEIRKSECSRDGCRHTELSKGAPCVKWGGRAPDTQYVVPGDPQQHLNAAGLHVLALKILPVLEKLLVQKH